MLIDCICGESKFAINAEQIGFDGRLVKCGKCGKEWFQESKLNIVEKKLIDLDQTLHTKEIKVANERNLYCDKISSLERELEAKNKEIESQKILEKRLALFESRVKDNESETSRQKTHEERINVLQKELEKKTLDLFIKNTALEKRSVSLQEKMDEKSLSDRLSSLEEKLVERKIGGKVINTKKPIEVFDRTEDQQSSEVSAVNRFEIDEIKKINRDEDSQPTKKEVEEKKSYTKIHEDDEESARIGRSGDPLKRKKI